MTSKFFTYNIRETIMANIPKNKSPNIRFNTAIGQYI